MEFITKKFNLFMNSMSSPHKCPKAQSYELNDINSSLYDINCSSKISSNGSISANKLVDKLLDYLRDNYIKAIDPYEMLDNYVCNHRKYGMSCQQKYIIQYIS